MTSYRLSEILAFLPLLLMLCNIAAGNPTTMPFADITVAADGSGDFKTVQQAVDSIPKDNRQRIVIFIKPGIYEEKIRIEKSNITLLGQDRRSTRLEFNQVANDYNKNRDPLSRAVVNFSGDDIVLQNLTIENTYPVIGKPHAVAVYGTGDRTVILDCDCLSNGADTVSLWRGKDGHYYHAGCNFRGAIDFVCPRGWCFITDSSFYENRLQTGSIWHDGHVDKDMKLVLRNCKFDGMDDFQLGRHKEDAAFYLLNCTFSKNMSDIAPYRYPIITADSSDADKQAIADTDAENVWGERAYYFNCHRTDGDYAWFKDNLAAAPGSPAPDQITAAWTFADKWDPESTAGPKTQSIKCEPGKISITFTEPVTVKGVPQLRLADNTLATYSTGSGDKTVIFTTENNSRATPTALILNGARVYASQASVHYRPAEFQFPRPVGAGSIPPAPATSAAQ